MVPVSRRSTPSLRLWATAVFAVLFAAIAAAGLGAYDPAYRLPFVEATIPGFYSHASNLALSASLLLCYGMVRLLYGTRAGELAIAAGVLVAANYGYELGLTLWNTKDPVDAHYGLVGTLAAWVFLVAVGRAGLRTRTPSPPPSRPSSSPAPSAASRRP